MDIVILDKALILKNEKRVIFKELFVIRRRSSYETLDEVYKDFKGKIAREVFRKIYNKETYKGIE